eukprot:8680437-Heterocapsa_arctica.AAC.1
MKSLVPHVDLNTAEFCYLNDIFMRTSGANLATRTKSTCSNGWKGPPVTPLNGTRLKLRRLKKLSRRISSSH